MQPQPNAAGEAVIEAADPARYIRLAFEGGDMTPLIAAELDILAVAPADPGALINLSLLHQLVGQPEEAMRRQAAALQHCRLYRHDCGAGSGQGGSPDALRLLVVVTAGDLMTNTPVELMLENRPVEITRLFVDAGSPLPALADGYDVTLIAVSESDATRPVLERLAGLGGAWPAPAINDPARIAALSRDRLYLELADAPGIVIPATLRLPRETLEAGVGADAFPLIVRPVGSHAGRGLEKLETAQDLRGYLAQQPAPLLYVSPFVDYASPDGRFRKYRIAFFDGRPFLCHMAVGDHWMVHYLNAGMDTDAAKRLEEQQAMERFDEDFARRHAAGFRSLYERLGLDYFAVDCAELADGSLLVFEADVAMIVHDLDSPGLYPYKKPQLRKTFDAFEAFLRARKTGRR